MMLMSVPTPPPPTQQGRYRNPWAWMVVVLSVVVVALTIVVTVSLVGDNESDATLAPGAEPAPGPTVSGPPCFGLLQVGNLPGWGDNLAFGEHHDLGGQNIVDLRDLIGCEIPGGVVTVVGNGVFNSVFRDDCQQFSSMDIPAVELRPDHSWVCYEPAGGGAANLVTVYKQG